MSFTLSEFKSKLSGSTKGGGARASLYEVTIVGGAVVGTSVSLTAPTGTGEVILVKSTQIPGETIAAETVMVAGRPVKYSGKRTYENWTTTIINDENFSIRNKVMTWMISMAGKLDSERVIALEGANPLAAGYKEGTGTVKQLGTDGAVSRTYTLSNLWPTTISPITVDWSADGIEEFTVEWCFDASISS